MALSASQNTHLLLVDETSVSSIAERRVPLVSLLKSEHLFSVGKFCCG